MTCPECMGIGQRADPEVMELIVANLVAGGDRKAQKRLDTLFKASPKKGKYWMVDTCPRCNGTGEI